MKRLPRKSAFDDFIYYDPAEDLIVQWKRDWKVDGKWRGWHTYGMMGGRLDKPLKRWVLIDRLPEGFL